MTGGGSQPTVDVERQGEDVVVRVAGALDRNVPGDLLRRLLAARKQGKVVWIDLSGVAAMDSVGAAVLDTASQRFREAGQEVRLQGASEPARVVLRTLPAVSEAASRIDSRGFFEDVGKRGLDFFASAGSLAQLVAEVVARGVLDPLRGRVPSMALSAREAIRIGVDAFPVVTLIGLLMGVVLGFQGAHQLRQFGADILVADLVALGIVREFGPLMTAIIVAGRSGSAIAAEIGTMVVREEVDALKTMGIDPVRYLVVPKFYAITIAGPALTIFSMAVGIVGGLVIGIWYLDLAPGAYWGEVGLALGLIDAAQGLGKSLVFSWIVVLVSTYQGLHISGGAVGVGRSTTTSVVSSIFLIIVADSIITTAFTVLG